MTPRNPDDKPQEDLQKTNLQPFHEAHATRMRAPADQKPQGSADLSPSVEDKLETEVELDRVEMYLKGPTAFTA